MTWHTGPSPEQALLKGGGVKRDCPAVFMPCVKGSTEWKIME